MRKIGLLQSVRIYLGEKPSILELIAGEIERGTEFSIDDSLDLSKNSKLFEKRIGKIVYNSIDKNSKIGDKRDFFKEVLIKHGLIIVNRVSGNDKNLMTNLYVHYTNEHFFNLYKSYQHLNNKSRKFRLLSVQGWFYHFLIMDDEFRREIFFDKNYNFFWQYYIPHAKNIYLERELQIALEERTQFYELNTRFRKENEGLKRSISKTEIEETKVIDNQNEHDNIIIFENDAWIIKYNGKTTPLKNSIGMRYIVYLINNSNQRHHVLDLYKAIQIKNEATENKNYAKMAKIVTENGNANLLEKEEHLSTIRYEEGIENFSKDDKKKYQKYLIKLDEDIENAKELNDDTTIERLTIEKQKLEDFLCKNLDRFGRPKKTHDELNNKKKSISTNIKRSIDSINKNSNFKAHLIDSIKSKGSLFYYNPTNPFQWDIHLS